MLSPRNSRHPSLQVFIDLRAESAKKVHITVSNRKDMGNSEQQYVRNYFFEVASSYMFVNHDYEVDLFYQKRGIRLNAAHLR